MEKLGLDSTGKLNFHLKKLSSLVDKDNKSYFLTEDGKRILRIINLNKRILAGEDIEYLNSKGSDISRVGVIICNCNTEISSVINVNALSNYISKLNNVVSVRIFENLCQQKNFDQIANWVKENFINKIVIAACSPKSHQHLFEHMLDSVIDRTNIEIANIREQCAWVHHSSSQHLNPLFTLEKAKLLIESAVERVILQKNIKIKRVEVEKSCAVIGGGIAGMTIALNLARAGIKVYLIEKSPTIGGKVARWHRIFGMGDCSICFISELISELAKEKNIKIYTNTEIEKVSGEVGNFTIDLIKNPRYIDVQKCTGCKQCIDVCTIEKPDQYEFGLTNRKIIYLPFIHSYPYVPLIDEEDIENCKKCRVCERRCVNNAIDLSQKPEKFRIKAGTKVIAIGSDLSWDLDNYSYDPQSDILTSVEFERILSSDGPTEGKIVKLSDNTPPKTISIIQCVEPSQKRTHLFDTLALKYINCIKVKSPDTEVNVFYDLSKMNDHQDFMISSKDPRFHYVENLKISKNYDQNVIMADSQEFKSDLIILNINFTPNKDLKALRKKMDFTLEDSGYMSEDTLASGIYGAGTILGPLDYNSTISSANNVTLKIINLLSHDYLIAEFSGIEINEEKCGLCGLCTNSCPYNALTIEKDKVNIDKFKCKGCGTCVSVCPTNALEMNIDNSEKVYKTVNILSKFKKHPKIIAFCCHSCGYAAADDAGLKKVSYNPNVFIVKVPCTGRVDTDFIIRSFEAGFDGVMIIGCRQDACRYIDGVQKAQKKVNLLKDILGPKYEKRIVLKNLNAVEGIKFAESVNEFYKQLEEEIKYEP